MQKAIEPIEFELHPQYPVRDEMTGAIYVIGLAFFYPRTDGLEGKIKVAIECGDPDTSIMEKQHEKDRCLQSQGWLIARFTGSEVMKKDIYDLIFEVDKLAANKNYELYQETEKHRINWRLN